MTNNNLLDSILSGYLHATKMSLEGDKDHSRLTFAFIAKSQEPTIEDWHIKFLKKQLFDDGFLIGDTEPYELTASGIKAAQVRLYSNNSADKETDKQIKTETLADLKRSKKSLFLSWLSFIVPTLISLYSLYTSTQSVSTEEVQQLREQLHKMESSKIVADTVSISLPTTTADSLEMKNKSN